MKRINLKGILLIGVTLSRIVFWYLAGLMLIIYLEQGPLSFLSIPVGQGYSFHILGASYLGIAAGFLVMSERKKVDKEAFEKLVDDSGELPKRTTVGIGTPGIRWQVFMMASFTLIMEIFLTFKGAFPKERLIIGAIVCVILSQCCKLLLTCVVRWLIKTALSERDAEK